MGIGAAGEDKKPFRTLLALAESLETSLYEDDDFNPYSARDHYRTILKKLHDIDTNVDAHLSNVHYSSDEDQWRSSILIAVSQMVAYLRAKVPPNQEMPTVGVLGGSVVSFLEMLPSHGLGIKWAISAAMLSLVEVITNETLAKLKLDNSGEFDKRVNRLNSALKARGIEIPALLLSGLYKVRSKVIHEGKEPTTEEMTTIFEILRSLHEKIK